MPKEEILKKHIDKYRKIRIVNESVVATVEQSILEAMEEHAKEEAIGFDNWKRNHSWVMDHMKSRSHTNAEYWNEYQKNKSK